MVEEIRCGETFFRSGARSSEVGRPVTSERGKIGVDAWNKLAA